MACFLINFRNSQNLYLPVQPHLHNRTLLPSQDMQFDYRSLDSTLQALKISWQNEVLCCQIKFAFYRLILKI